MNSQKGVIHLVALLLLLAAGGILYALIYFGIIDNPFKNLPLIGSRDARIDLKEEYQNPFKKETQYVNPFETKYKNPFIVNK